MRSSHKRDAARRTSDAEITRPQNDFPSEPPPLPAWHVHLELQPEELITLHRLGFTGGALAWREGMPEWQPLHVEQGPRDAAPPEKEDSLPQPIPLTRRSGSSAGSVTSLDRRRASLFNSGRQSTPPIALAVPHKSDRPRPELMLPPPPPIEARNVELTVVEPGSPSNEPWLKLDQSRSPISAVREQQPPSIPPLSLEAKPRASRTGGSRALWLGAAALVALSASNGALVSALLWSLRHDAARPVASAARAALAAPLAASGAAPAAQCPTPSAATPLDAAAAASTPSPSASAGRAAPVSVEQLPLLGAVAAAERSSAEHPHTRGVAPGPNAGPSRATGPRKSSTRVVLAEEAASPRRAEPPASTATVIGPIDRRALAQAVARAAGSASSCADGPEKGRVALTFSPSGSVQAVQLEQSFGEPGINSCVLRAMGRARVRPFTGEPVTVHKTLSW